MRPNLLLIGLAFAVFPLCAIAQTQTKVLSGKDLNESALIDALTPSHTRSLKVDHALALAHQVSASLLITFETNSANLTPQAKHSLDTVGRALGADQLAPFKFSIEGHADPRGGTELNQRLSEHRAQSVRRYLVQNHRIDPQRLTSVGKGDKEPLNETYPAAPENRRVTFVTIEPWETQGQVAP
jgi:OmpA-OmpF porin, OOP family